jgi:hypothetical protein
MNQGNRIGLDNKIVVLGVMMRTAERDGIALSFIILYKSVMCLGLLMIA